MINDSGNRREFESGAVRDMPEGKGRCDLMPLDVVAELLDDNIIYRIHLFQESEDVAHLIVAMTHFAEDVFGNCYDAILEVSKHFEEGAKKYGENNWQKGIPTSSYIDSAVRHYLKYKRGDTDERHDRAFLWNLVCCVWEAKNNDETAKKNQSEMVYNLRCKD